MSDAGGVAWKQRAGEALAAAGYRRGGARAAIVELLDGQSCALSAAEIERRLRHARRGVSRASVYRVMDELQHIGLLQRVELGGVTRYEPALGSGFHHHHHLVCELCGAVAPFRDEGLERAIERVSGRVALHVSEHEVVIRGACGECTARR